MKKFKDWLIKNKMWVIIGTVVVLLLVIAIVSENGGGGVMNLAGAAFCDTSPLATNPRLGMIVAPSGMYVRTGPGTNYALVNPGKPGLVYCSTFEMLGRSADSNWLEVTGDGLRGWIKYDTMWEMINLNIKDLPVSNNIASPQGSAPSSGSGSGSGSAPSSGKGIQVSITNNVATVTISGLPANTPYYVMLAPEGSNKEAFVFREGKSDSSGWAQFQANMPSTWGNGTPVTSGNMVIGAYITKTEERVAYLVFPYYR